MLRSAAVLRSLGYDVSIIGSQTARDPRRRELVDGTPVVRIRARSPLGVLARRGLPRGLRGAHRWLTALDWHRRAALQILRRRPGLIHANDHNTMWSAVLGKVLLRARVIYDSHELWADRNGRPEWRAWVVLWEWWFVRVADAVVTASPGYADELARRYRVPVPVVVRNIPDVPAQAGAARDPAECVYVGGLMPGRGLEAAIAALASVPEVRLRLIGDGRAAYVEGLRASASRAGVAERVRFAGTVAPGDVVAAASTGGFGLCLIEPVCRSYELTLPNKLFEYAAAGLPILASDLPVIAATVAAHGLGLTVPPGDVPAVAAAMRRLAQPPENREVGSRSAAFAGEATWDRERERLVRVYRA